MRHPSALARVFLWVSAAGCSAAAGVTGDGTTSETGTSGDSDVGTTTGMPMPPVDLGDGAGTDAGTTTGDAGSSGTSSDTTDTESLPPQPSCTMTSYAFCDDFESGAIDTNVWQTTSTPLEARVDETRAARGSYALHFSDAAQFRTTAPFPTLETEMWGRLYVYMIATPPGSTETMEGPNSSIAASGGNGGLYRFGFRHTRFSSGFNYPGYDQTHTDDSVWPLDQWVCVEWHHVSDPLTGDGTQDYWLDGVERPLTHFDAHPMPAFTYFWVAEYLFGSPYEMWIDEVVLDTSRVGCD